MKLAFILCAEILLFCTDGMTKPFSDPEHPDPNTRNDTVFIHKGRYFLNSHISINIPRDTFYIMHPNRYHGKSSGSVEDSKAFYDTVYKVFSRKKITQFLYYLAFVAPKQSDLPDSVQVIRNASPFEEFHGKLIRKISVRVLSPFGTNVYDTGRQTVTGVGNALNDIHVNSRKYVIRRNLIVKEGDRVIPSVLADNERLLRNITSFDDARIVVLPGSDESDSVDLVVLVKDVWSIGVDIPMITPHQVRFRIYDANFLGQGDRLTTTMSMELYKSPFYLFEGLSYTFTNIGSSFINTTVGYSADRTGNTALFVNAERLFLTDQTKWAGGAYASLETFISDLSEGIRITSRFNREGIWAGWAFLIPGLKDYSRGVLSAAVYRKQYTSRPLAEVDSTTNYSDQVQVLGSLSLSKNSYYLTDYVRDFGEIENLPYGHLFQLTLGRDQCGVSARFYTGVHISAGNFFDNFGYLAASLKLAGYPHHSSLEDCVVKSGLHYFTPLLKTSDKRYKFRIFSSADYRYAFNPQPDNHDYYDANLDFRIDKVSDQDYFNGVQVLTGKLSAVCFPPWYFYGFRFGLMMEYQAGLVARGKESLFRARLFSTAGLSFIIKNDNLIFPAFMLSVFYYPASPGNYSHFEFMANSNLQLQYQDFNVTAPHVEKLGN